MIKEWQVFEKSISAFLQALDPNSKVKHDAQTLDKDTGDLRQRDVWIETWFGGHLPILILVSCKRKKAKISQQDVDAFIGELRSSSAHVGVLYSYSGYTKPALEKAKVVGISCCVFHDNEAPRAPEALTFNAFCNTEMTRISMSRDLSLELPRLRDLFDLPTSLSDEKPILRTLVELYNIDRTRLLENLKGRMDLLPTWSSTLELKHASLSGAVELTLIGGWSLYQAKMEYYQLNGSYSFTSKDFKGTIATPSVDIQSSHPGPGWELLNGEIPATKNVVGFILYGSNLEERIREMFSDMSFTEWVTSARA